MLKRHLMLLFMLVTFAISTSGAVSCYFGGLDPELNGGVITSSGTISFYSGGLGYEINGDTGNVIASELADKRATSVTIPAQVTHNGVTYPVSFIRASLYSNSNYLREINIEDGTSRITLIAEGFITLPEVERIYLGRGSRNLVFYNSPKLKEVKIGGCVEELADKTFKNCPMLSTIEFLPGETELSLNSGNEVFYGTSLENIILRRNASYLSILNQSEYKEGMNRKVTITPECHSCGNSLHDFNGLKEVIIEESEEPLKLLDNPFNKSSVESVVIKRPITGTTSVFSSMASLKTLELGGGLKTINVSMFCNNKMLSSVNFGYVTTIGDMAFEYCESLPDVILPESVETVGEYAFRGCKAVTAVKLSPKMTKLENCFIGCSSLPTITIPSNILEISSWCFTECDALKEVIIEENETSLKLWDNPFNKSSIESVVIKRPITGSSSAFNSMNALKTVELGGGFKTINVSMFCNNKMLSSVNFGSVSFIGDMAFEYCESLPDVILPESVETVGDYAFRGCKAVTAVKLSPQMTKLGNCFIGCSSLPTITIPGNIIEISSWCFNKCDAMKEVIIAESETPLKLWDNPFNKSSIESVVIKRQITGSSSAFYSMAALKTLELGGGLKTINTAMFNANKELASVLIGENVERIESSAFSECGSIRRVNSLAIVPPVCESENVFPAEVYANATLNVEGRALKSYRSAEVWKNFSSIIAENLEYAVSFTIESGRGTVYVNGSAESPVMVKDGVPATVRVQPDEGYEILSVEVNGASQSVDPTGCFTLKGLDKDVEIRVSFSVIRFSLSADYDHKLGEVIFAGAIDPSGMADYGSEIAVTITPAFGHHVTSLTVNGSARGEADFGGFTIGKLTSDLNVSVDFAPNVYSFTTDFDPTYGSVTVNGAESGAELTFGSTAEIAILPAYGYQLARATLDGEDVTDRLAGGVMTIAKIDADHHLSVEFELRRVNLLISVGEGGYISQTFDFGSTARLRIVTEPEWEFHSLTFGREVFTELDDDHSFVTPPLTDDVKVKFVFSNDIADSASPEAADEVSLTVTGLTVNVNGAAPEDILLIATPGGMTVYSGMERRIELPCGGVYLIRIGSRTFKILV